MYAENARGAESSDKKTDTKQDTANEVADSAGTEDKLCQQELMTQVKSTNVEGWTFIVIFSFITLQYCKEG